MTNISTDRMMAFGDADNDIEMLASVNYGYAMEGCNDRLAAVAHKVIGSNNEDGVAHHLASFFDL